MALKKECPGCKYRNPTKVRRCRKCGRELGTPVVWWVDIHFNGIRVRKRIGPDRKAAELAELEFRKAHARRKVLGEDDGLTLESLWVRYIAWCRIHNRDVEHKIQRWKKHLAPVFAHIRLTEISIPVVETYRQRRLSEGARPSTVNRETSLLRHMLAMAVRWGLLPQNPLAGLGNLPEKNDDRWTYITVEEAERLLENIENPDYRQLVEFLLYSGRRLGEALELRWRDVDLDRGVLLLRGSRNKSGKTFGFPLHPRALRVLRERVSRWNGSGVPQEERVFPLSKKWLQKAFKKALKKAGLPESIRIHDLRHTFASWLAMKGVPLQQIQALLGHRQISTTLRYAHLNPEVLRGALEKI